MHKESREGPRGTHISLCTCCLSCPVPGFTLCQPASLQLSPLMCKLKNADKIVNVFNLRRTKSVSDSNSQSRRTCHAHSARNKQCKRRNSLPTVAATIKATTATKSHEKSKQQKQIKNRIENRASRDCNRCHIVAATA